MKEKMTDKDTIIRNFIANFVIKEKRERSLLELMTPKRRDAFIGRFNHNWDTVVNMEYVDKVAKQLDYPEKVAELVELKGSDLCYVISHYEEVDDQILRVEDVLGVIYGRGFASIITNLTATRFYLETEQVQGPPERFIGKRTKN